MLSAARVWGATALTAAVVLGSAAAPAFAAADAARSSASARASASASASASALPPGLYGSADPSADGVYRQSLSLLALNSQNVTPAPASVEWLLNQQCADGGWPSFSADPKAPCSANGEDVRASALAVAALGGLGDHPDAVSKAVNWFKVIQNQDGGWATHPGGTSDADSTALAVVALTSAKTDPATVRHGTDPTAVQALTAYQVPCTEPNGGGFATALPKPGATATPDALASAQGALAVALGTLPVAHGSARTAPSPSAGCAEPADSAADYLAGQLSATGGVLSQTPQTPRPTTSTSAGASASASASTAPSASAAPSASTAPSASADASAGAGAGAGAAPTVARPSRTTAEATATAWSVLALAHQGRNTDAQSGLNWLAGNPQAWSPTDPATVALLLLDAKATGANPATAFPGTDLVAQLESTGPSLTPSPSPAAPSPSTASAPATASAAPSPHSSGGSGGGLSSWWLIPVGLAAGAGIGLFFSYQRSRQRD